MSSAHSVLVSGGGGFIGGYLASALLADGAEVRAVDVKPVEEWHQHFDGVENLQLDLRLLEDCRRAAEGMDHVYNLACDMGGMGYIEANKASCMLSVLINTHLLQAAKEQSASRYFFASSACVYASDKQASAEVHLSANPMPIRPVPRTAMGGRSSSASGCAATSRRTTAWRPGSPGTTTSMAPMGHMRAVARRLRPRSAGRWRRRSCPAITRSRSGVTGSRRAASPSSTIASRGRSS